MKLLKSNSFIQTSILKKYLRKIYKGGFAKTIAHMLNNKDNIFLYINGIIEVSKPVTNQKKPIFNQLLLCGYFKLDKNPIKNSDTTGLLIIPSNGFSANNKRFEKPLLVKDLHELIESLKFKPNYSLDGFDGDQSKTFFLNTLNNLAFDKIIELSMFYEVHKLESTINEFDLSLLELLTPEKSYLKHMDNSDINELESLLRELNIEQKYRNNILGIEKNLSDILSDEIRKNLTQLGVEKTLISAMLNNTQTNKNTSLKDDENDKQTEKLKVVEPTSRVETVKMRNLKISIYALTELLGKYPAYQKHGNLNVSKVADAIVGFYSEDSEKNFDGKIPSSKTISNNHSNIKKEIEGLIDEAFNENHNNFSQK